MSTPNMPAAAISRRLTGLPGGIPLPPIGAPLTDPTAPLTTMAPAPAPGQPPTVTANTGLVKTLFSPPDPGAAPAGGDTIQDALGRALVGFGRGVAATPATAYGGIALGGIEGGLSSIGQGYQDAMARRMNLQAPYREAQQKYLDAAATAAAQEPTERAHQQEDFEKSKELANEAFLRENSPEMIEGTARNLIGMPPTLWSNVLGRSGGPFRAAVFQRLSELQPGVTQQDLETKYQTNLAGGKAAAALDSGGNAQQSARAASTVQSLLPGLQAASDNFGRTNVRFLNTPIAALDVTTGGTAAMNLKQYLTDTKFKMAAALQNGGVPTETATRMMAEAFPDNITPSQVPAAIKNITAIMETQKRGALTPVSIQPPAPAPTTPVAGKFDWRSVR